MITHNVVFGRETLASYAIAMLPDEAYDVTRHLAYVEAGTVGALSLVPSEVPMIELAIAKPGAANDSGELVTATRLSMYPDDSNEVLAESAVIAPPEQATPFTELLGERRRAAMSMVSLALRGLLEEEVITLR